MTGVADDPRPQPFRAPPLGEREGEAILPERPVQGFGFAGLVSAGLVRFSGVVRGLLPASAGGAAAGWTRNGSTARRRPPVTETTTGAGGRSPIGNVRVCLCSFGVPSWVMISRVACVAGRSGAFSVSFLGRIFVSL